MPRWAVFSAPATQSSIWVEQWARFRDTVPVAWRDGNLADAYARLLAHPDPATRERAAIEWCAWESAHVAMDGDDRPDPRYNDPTFRMAFARLVTHYFRHAAWLEEGLLLRDAAKLAAIPDTAWALSRAWPASSLTLIEGAGHGAGNRRIDDILRAATNRFATLD